MKRHAVALSIAILVMLMTDLPALRAADTPIGVITRGGPDLVLPASSTDNLPVRYGLGFPVQLGPTTVGLFCNLRVVGVGRTDYEDGTDVFVFDDLASLSRAQPMPILRNEKEKDAATGEARFIVKYPAVGGFWPLGAKQADGSPHPGAGKGFALCQALSFVGDGQKLTWDMFSQPTMRCFTEVMQLSFDGKQVSVPKRELIRTGQGWPCADGWGINANGIASAIPDGADLLMATSGQKAGVGRTGVCRFRFVDGEWRPVAFTPISSGGEPSLVRRALGPLVFLTRPSEDMGPDAPRSIMLWQSDDGAAWRQIVSQPNLRPTTPVTVNATPDGTVFVLANVPGMTQPDGKVRWWHLDRAQIAMWQLNDTKHELQPGQLIRDCVGEFGPPPADMVWDADHANSATVRLADQQWHGLIVYRVMQYSVQGDKVGEAVTPHTGCYVEEMPPSQPVTPPWRF